MNNTGIKRLLGKKGESLILVLILMFFFMIVCVSVSSAAISTIRYVGIQTDFNQAMLLEKSIHDNIMYSLQVTDPLNPHNSLGWQVVNAIQLTNANAGDAAGDIHITGITIAGFNDVMDGRISIESVTLRLTEQRIIPRNAVAALYQTEYHPTRCFITTECMSAPPCRPGGAGPDPNSPFFCNMVCRDEFHSCCDEAFCPITTPGHSHCSFYDSCPFQAHFLAHVNGIVDIDTCIIVCMPAVPHHACEWEDNTCIAPGALMNPVPLMGHECIPGWTVGDPIPPLCDIEGSETRDGARYITTFLAPRIPRSQMIIATLDVIVVIDIDGALSRSRAVFSYTGGEMSDCLQNFGECVAPFTYVPGDVVPNEEEDYDNDCCMSRVNVSHPFQFVAGLQGRWEFLYYENMES